MKVLKVILASISILLMLLALVGPLGPIPGLFIGGTSAKAPEKWDDTSNVDEIMLRVPGTVPRVVIIWFVEHGGELHVVGNRKSGWVAMIGAEFQVEMRLGDNTYALQAIAVTEGWEPILEAYVAKYHADYPDTVAGFPSIDEAKNRMAVFRLNRT